MRRVNHLSNGKSVMVLGTVVGCLIILWPKVFYPMMQGGGGGFQKTNQDINLKSRIHPRMMTSKVPAKGFNGQPTAQGSESNIPLVDHSSIGGASVGLIMTIYTIGIIFLFFYTIFKYLSSDGSLDHIDEGDNTIGNGQDYCDTDFQENKMKGETFDKNDHPQGECLKKLAINYIRCKSKLFELDISPAIANYDDGVSMAYRTLLGDMLQLRDYLYELQCSVHGCDVTCDEFCNCSDEIIDNREEPDPHDIDFDIGEAINQMFGLDQEDDTDATLNEEKKLSENEDESEKESTNLVSDDLIDSRMIEDDTNQLIKTKLYQRKTAKSNN